MATIEANYFAAHRGSQAIDRMFPAYLSATMTKRRQ
jgi:hypothetical protein